jgi:hypothetical protein
MQQITTKNYYTITKGIDWKDMPEKFRESHAFAEGLHSSGTKDFLLYDSDRDIAETIDFYFKDLAKYLDGLTQKHTPANPSRTKLVTMPPTQSQANADRPGDNSANPRPSKLVAIKATTRKSGKANPKKTGNPPAAKALKATIPGVKKAVHKTTATTPKTANNYAEKIPDEIRFIKRYANLNDKIKTKPEVLNFINALQKAIIERRIRKTSSFAKQVEYVQEKLVELYHKMRGQTRIEIPEKKLLELKAITGREKVFSTIEFIKKYMRLNGKPAVKAKAKLLLEQLRHATQKGDIKPSMPYHPLLNEMKKNLEQFTKEKNVKTLHIEPAALSGLQGALNGLGSTSGLNGLDNIVQVEGDTSIINSMDFANLQFESLGFRQPWLDFMGDPAPGFTAMVFGKPKFGKSMLCAAFAAYLARNHGRVLYVVREEGIDKTSQEKLAAPHIRHPNLTVADGLPTDLSPYDFIFLDSVTKLGLEPQDLEALQKRYSGKSFIYVFQVTKDGLFRGANKFQHDVDMVIEVPQWGRAVQYGRYNQGGEMEIFGNNGV